MAAYQANRQYEWHQQDNASAELRTVSSLPISSRPAASKIIAKAATPRVTDSYLHIQQVKSRFKKHTSKLHLAFQGFVVLAILFGLVQSFRAIVSSTFQISSLLGNQAAVSDLYSKAALDNQVLKEHIATYSSAQGIEELARNNLEMVGKDEVLVRLR